MTDMSQGADASPVPGAMRPCLAFLYTADGVRALGSLARLCSGEQVDQVAVAGGDAAGRPGGPVGGAVLLHEEVLEPGLAPLLEDRPEVDLPRAHRDGSAGDRRGGAGSGRSLCALRGGWRGGRSGGRRAAEA